jgi:hypothetical protein
VTDRRAGCRLGLDNRTPGKAIQLLTIHFFERQ